MQVQEIATCQFSMLIQKRRKVQKSGGGDSYTRLYRSASVLFSISAKSWRAITHPAHPLIIDIASAYEAMIFC